MMITITYLMESQRDRPPEASLYDWRDSPPYESREDAERDALTINALIGRPEPIDGIPWLRGYKGDEISRAYVTDDTEITM